ncbi:hypothetical protein HOG17_02570 [Candidatus Peregrinibacteria bacterium]|jgi:adenosine deaminase|nr:hypothetical protein [Candidatus Peregrinibacteria bacterium]MBT4147929.1 hypothetical protein [Candidatus Peregrinibacteria bacterium]MBT4456095.1 hypothetical protein [Candidatus Peregrinibacteria bacterium]
MGKNKTMDRRDFLKLGAGLTGVAVVAGCAPSLIFRGGAVSSDNGLGFEDVPFVDLHRHLEAGLSPEMVATLAQRNKVEKILKYKSDEALPLDPQDPESIQEYFRQIIPTFKTPKGFRNFLSSLSVPLSVIKSLEDLRDVTRWQIQEQALKGCVHLEFRGSPYTYKAAVDGEPSYEEVIGAIHDGIRSMYEKSGLSATYIACFSKQKADQYAEGVVDVVAKMHTSDFPLGLDLAGVEPGFPPSKFRDVIAPVREAGAPITIHAGEQSRPPRFEKAPASFISEAIDVGARRIGHGTSLISDPRLMDYCRDKGVHVETCPVSNDLLGYMPVSQHPLRQFLDHGISVSVGTDDPLSFGSESVRELLIRNADALRISPEDVVRMTQYGVEAAFVSDKRRQELRKKIGVVS